MLLLFLEILSLFAFSYLGLCVLSVTGMQLFSSQARKQALLPVTTTGPFVCPRVTQQIIINANSDVPFTIDGTTPSVVSASALPDITVQ